MGKHTTVSCDICETEYEEAPGLAASFEPARYVRIRLESADGTPIASSETALDVCATKAACQKAAVARLLALLAAEAPT